MRIKTKKTEIVNQINDPLLIDFMSRDRFLLFPAPARRAEAKAVNTREAAATPDTKVAYGCIGP
jgi:hypothetical protein